MNRIASTALWSSSKEWQEQKQGYLVGGHQKPSPEVTVVGAVLVVAEMANKASVWGMVLKQS